MKIERVFKVTAAADCRSCLTVYGNTPPEVKNFLALQYSTANWTLLENTVIPNSGIFVFRELSDVAVFYSKNPQAVRAGLVCWEAKAFGLRKKKTFVVLNSCVTIDSLKSFWAGVLHRFGFERTKQNFYLADGVKLRRIVTVPPV
jgi:hypothetical protein